MNVQVSFAEEPAMINTLTIKSQLGTGKFTVYKVHSPFHDKNFALKVFPNNTLGTAQYHKEKLSFHLNHPNIIQITPIKCHHDEFHALLMEYARYGDFFELTTSKALEDEALMRTCFHQLISGLEYAHAQGVAHLDLKLENLMLGADFNLKIIDFDQAQPVSDKAINSGGTRDYRSPEILNGKCTNLAAADVYSAGVILYAFKAQEFPFVEMNDPEGKNLKSYKGYCKDKKAFWKSKAEQKRDSKFFSADFIELVNGMLNPDVKKRLTIKDIKKSKWFKGPVLSAEDFRRAMKLKIVSMRANRQ